MTGVYRRTAVVVRSVSGNTVSQDAAILASLVERDSDPDQVVWGHLAARDQVEHVRIVPGHDCRAPPVDVAGCRFRSELVHARVATCDSCLARRAAIRDGERETSGFLCALLRLTQDEAAVMWFQRSILDRKLTQLVIAHVDLDRLEAES